MAKNDYEKKTAKEMLNLVEQYIKSQDKKPFAEKLNKLSNDVYYKNQSRVSQKMIDLSLAIHSFTQACLSGGRFQDLEEFVPDLKEIIGG
ncbi:hypothetical protein HY449_02325 [Candidatus Pacearchaeota archaeon]|nr:hypothetical protein [Candidatus Pacearchaeota archaeon]